MRWQLQVFNVDALTDNGLIWKKMLCYSYWIHKFTSNFMNGSENFNFNLKVNEAKAQSRKIPEKEFQRFHLRKVETFMNIENKLLKRILRQHFSTQNVLMKIERSKIHSNCYEMFVDADDVKSTFYQSLQIDDQ